MRSKKTVLLINNSQVFMDLTKRVLERAGYAVRCAAGDSEAHEQMEEFVPDAIILDSDLPEGFECFQSPIMETPVPMMILSSDKNCELQALQSGAVDFMKKPFDFEIMKARLALMLKEPPAQPETEGDQRDNGAAAGEGQSESVAALEAQKTQKKTFKFRYLYIAAACMVLVLFGTGLFRMLGAPSPDTFEVIVFEDDVPLANWKFASEQDEMAIKGIEIPDIDENITIPKGATKLQMPLVNPQGNPCLLTFELILEDTGESIYTSPMVEPGEGIGEIELSRGLAQGEHKMVMKIRAYEIGDLADMGNCEIEFVLAAN